LERELLLLERVSWLFPDVSTVVVGDTENPVLAGLAWDLGASSVLFPPLPLEQLPDLVAGWLAAPPGSTPPTAAGEPPDA
jgi:hypothetical protein